MGVALPRQATTASQPWTDLQPGDRVPGGTIVARRGRHLVVEATGGHVWTRLTLLP